MPVCRRLRSPRRGCPQTPISTTISHPISYPHLHSTPTFTITSLDLHVHTTTINGHVHNYTPVRIRCGRTTRPPSTRPRPSQHQRHNHCNHSSLRPRPRPPQLPRPIRLPTDTTISIDQYNKHNDSATRDTPPGALCGVLELALSTPAISSPPCP